ncbi:MAG: hypothetical protein JOY71_02960, partial [Acetobacteraceae bacterium]|nr:hypothetical protein [Acetobacteraceae bacterium]
LEAERARLIKERSRAQQDADKLGRKLDNPDFVRRAPPEVVEETRVRLNAVQQELARLDAALRRVEA